MACQLDTFLLLVLYMGEIVETITFRVITMSRKRILITDDDPNLVKSLTFVLNKEGYETDIAVNGEEAISKVHESKPALMFLDIMMPKKNGYEVCQELKSSPDFSDMYIIMLTAKGQEEDRVKALESKADEFVTKPFSPVEIVKRVNQILG